MFLQKNKPGSKNISHPEKENKKDLDEIPGKLIQILKEELACPICKELFENPQVLQCGHLFCYKCLKSWLAHGMMSRYDDDREETAEEEENEKKKVTGCPLCSFEIVRFPIFNQAVASLVDRLNQVLIKQTGKNLMKKDDKRAVKRRKLEEYEKYELDNPEDNPTCLFKRLKKMYPELSCYESNTTAMTNIRRNGLNERSIYYGNENLSNDSDSMVCRTCGWEISNQRGLMAVAGRRGVDFCIPCARMLWFRERTEEKAIEQLNDSTSSEDENEGEEDEEEEEEEEEEREYQYESSDSRNASENLEEILETD